ncbi:hypothetical protein Tco_1343290 [Tanacetum coccineum]
MYTLAEFMMVAGADNRPPMLDKPQYESWKSRMELYIQGKDNGRIILKSVETVPLSGLLSSPDVYALVNHHKVAKDIWDRVKLLMQGTSLSKQERECKMYDKFDKFSYVKGETLHQYYLWSAQLINDMNIIQMTMQPAQVNTKFLNSLPREWGKFVTDVKLARDLHMSNYDQLYAYFKQHEVHANETRLMRERFPDPLALVANFHQQRSHFNNYHSQCTTPQYPQQFSPPTQHFPQIDSGLIVLTVLPGDDPITCMNKAMAFLLDLFTPSYPSTNNQLRSSSNLRNQATVQDGRVTVSKFKEDKVRMLSVQVHKGMLQVQGEIHQVKQRLSSVIIVKVKGIWLDSVLSQREEVMQHGLRKRCCLFKYRLRIDDPDAYDFDNDDICLAKAVLMANLSSCDSDVLSEANNESKSVNESLTTELDRYKERVKILEQRFNVDLSDHDKFIDSQMDDMIQMKNTKFAAFETEIDTLK